jgi:hypothetical protein
MTQDLELLLSCAERVSRVWRDGEAKTKDNLRQAMNEMDWTVADVKKRMGKQETKRLEKP